MELTPQEIQLFRHNGFIRFPTQLSKDHVEALKAAALQDMEEGVEPVARQDGRIIRISAVWQRGWHLPRNDYLRRNPQSVGIIIGSEYRICAESSQSRLSPRRRFNAFACVAS